METNIVTNNITLSSLIINADFLTKIIILSLIIMSIWSWAIIIEKMITFYLLRIKTAKFEQQFRTEKIFENLYNRIRTRVDNPLTSIFVAAIQEWKKNDIPAVQSSEALKASLKERLQQQMQISLTDSLGNLKRNLGFLATAASTAPFIGLFGTVWGIMNSFQAIAVMQNVNLTVVAPGISSALITTIIGLVVAIPASIFYNLYIGKINSFNDKAENFISKIITNLSRELDHQVNIKL